MVTTLQKHAPAARFCVFKGTGRVGDRLWLDMGKVYCCYMKQSSLGAEPTYIQSLHLMSVIIHKAFLPDLRGKTGVA